MLTEQGVAAVPADTRPGRCAGQGCDSEQGMKEQTVVGVLATAVQAGSFWRLQQGEGRGGSGSPGPTLPELRSSQRSAVRLAVSGAQVCTGILSHPSPRGSL